MEEQDYIYLFSIAALPFLLQRSAVGAYRRNLSAFIWPPQKSVGFCRKNILDTELEILENENSTIEKKNLSVIANYFRPLR